MTRLLKEILLVCPPLGQIQKGVEHMDMQKLDLWLMTNQKYFPAEKMPYIRDKLAALDESQFLVATSVELKDPTVMLIISIFLGGWGVDRFMMGDIGMGVLKLLTGGLCGILWLVDLITIMNKVKEMNFNSFMMMP